MPELVRGIRTHFTKMHKSIKDSSLDKAQLGLGHSYSRAKVRLVLVAVWGLGWSWSMCEAGDVCCCIDASPLTCVFVWLQVKFNVHRVDNMIIQAISLLDQLDKDINTFSMRIK